MTKLLPLTGIHHITAIRSSAEKNYDFFTSVLGMRLVKKTVNQDDVQTYHLFFADDKGTAGTDMTFFDFPGIPQSRHGNNEIYRSGLRVPNDRALEYWLKRFDHFGVKHTGIFEQFGVNVINFEDYDGQQMQLISDEHDTGVAPGTAWINGPVPTEFGIYGLGTTLIRVADFHSLKQVLEILLFFRETKTEGNLHYFEMGEGMKYDEELMQADIEKYGLYTYDDFADYFKIYTVKQCMLCKRRSGNRYRCRSAVKNSLYTTCRK